MVMAKQKATILQKDGVVEGVINVVTKNNNKMQYSIQK